MSLRFLSGLNSPPLVVAAGAAIVVGLPALEFSTASLVALKAANVLAFVTNVAAVSVPGRLDGQQDQAMRSGDLDPSKPSSSSSTPLVDNQQPQNQENLYSTIRTRCKLGSHKMTGSHIKKTSFSINSLAFLWSSPPLQHSSIHPDGLSLFGDQFISAKPLLLPLSFCRCRTVWILFCHKSRPLLWPAI